MKSRNHQKKPLTANAATFFKRLFPVDLFEKINKLYGLDKNRKKLFFKTFCIFLVLVIIIQPQDTTLRGIKNASEQQTIQLLSGQSPASHSAIGSRLNTIPTDCVETVLNNLISEFKKRLKYKSPVLKGMKVFDVTTFSVSEKHYKWAAKRQSRANIRFCFVMDSYSGTPDAIIDASKNLNDNKVFKEAVNSAKHEKVFVFDKGFNKFSIFKDITQNGKHFITRFKENYIFNLLKTRKINPNEKLDGDWFIESDEVGSIGIKNQKNIILIRKITCRNFKNGETFTVMSDERNWAANKIVKMYCYRWPIEVFFRHIKTNMKVIHFPSRDPQGVRNWMFFIVMSMIVIQLMTLDGRSNYTISIMVPKSQFKSLIREAIIIIDNWIITAIKNTLE